MFQKRTLRNFLLATVETFVRLTSQICNATLKVISFLIIEIHQQNQLDYLAQKTRTVAVILFLKPVGSCRLCRVVLQTVVTFAVELANCFSAAVDSVEHLFFSCVLTRSYRFVHF